MARYDLQKSHDKLNVDYHAARLHHRREHRSRTFLGQNTRQKGRPRLHCRPEPRKNRQGSGPARSKSTFNPLITISLIDWQEVRVGPSQLLEGYSHSLDTAAASTAALEEVCAAHGGEAPDAVFACAGASKPMFFVEMTEEDLVNGMTAGYWVQAWTAWVSGFAKAFRFVCWLMGGMSLGSCEDDGETREKGEDCVGVFYAWVYVFLGLGVVFSC